MKLALSDNRISLILISIICAGLGLRLWELDYQSLWLDELHTMKVADPDISWSTLLGYLKNTDQHPPSHFILLRYCFAIFGHNSMVLRMASVIAGTFSIWAMYVLGKELWNKNLGLLAALLTAINHYLIFYSQEGRNYIFFFLISIYSFLYFLRLLRNLSLKNSLIYAFINILMLYTHYFGMFILVAQFLLGVIFFFNEESNKKVLFVKRFTVSSVLIIGLYLFWVPYILYISSIGSFWIPEPHLTIITDFFYEYFGNIGLLSPFITLFLLLYVLKITKVADSEERLMKQPFIMVFVFLFIWVSGTFLVPFLRSHLSIPVLISRYMIGVLPAYIFAVAFGILLINNRIIKIGAIVCFTILTMIDTTVVKQYYTKVTKSEYREITDFVMKHDQGQYPIVSSYAWQFSYYFKHNNYNTSFIERGGMHGVDSIVNLINTPQRLYGFWVVDGHSNDRIMNDEEKHELNKHYVLANRKYYFNAWAELYLYAQPDSIVTFINHNNFSCVPTNESIISLWGGNLEPSDTTFFTKGRYLVTVSATGGAAFGEFAKVQVLANDDVIGTFTTSAQLEANSFYIDINEDKNVVFKLGLTNDAMDAQTGEDRNAFVRFIRAEKKL